MLGLRYPCSGLFLSDYYSSCFLQRGFFSGQSRSVDHFTRKNPRSMCSTQPSPHIPSIYTHPVRVRFMHERNAARAGSFFFCAEYQVLHILFYTPNSKARDFRKQKRSQRRQIKNKKIQGIKKLAKAKTTRLSVEKQVRLKTDRSDNQKIQRSDKKIPSNKEKQKKIRSKRN